MFEYNLIDENKQIKHKIVKIIRILIIHFLDRIYYLIFFRLNQFFNYFFYQ